MHLLEQRLACFRRRVRRLMAVRALGRLAAVLVGSLIVLGFVDYWIRFDDPGLRVINSLLMAGLTVWACYRYLWQGLSARLGDLRLSEEIQRRMPGLGDRLSTAIEFLRQPDDDPTAGSASLRRAVIADVTAQTAAVDFATTLDPRPAWQAAIVALGAILVGAILAVVDPVSCRTAVARLARPTSSVAWPQLNHLELRRHTDQVARGQAFEVEVVAAQGTPLPGEIRIHYRFERPNGSTKFETERMRRQGASMIARRENVTRAFSYRVEGGDDHSQPWIDVAVVEPPAVESLAVRLLPPDYTGWPAYESNKQIRALAGTKAEFRGSATKALASAALVLDERRTIPAELPTPERFQLPSTSGPPIVLQRSGSYGLSLTDRQGVSNTEAERFEIRVVADGPPSAAIEHLAENLYVTPQGVVPLRATAKDDLAVASMELVFSRPEDARPETHRLTVYRGPARPAAQPAFSPAPALPAIEYRWDLGPLALAPRAAVTYYVEARDYAGAVGRSEPRRLAVVTADELLDRLSERQAIVASELGRVVAIERESRAQVGALKKHLGEAGRLEQLDVDHLQAAAMGQRQADLSLTSRTDGVAMHAMTILADVENNRLDAPGVQRRMQGLLDGIDRLERDHLPVIDQELTAAIKAAQIRLEQAGGKPAASEPDGALKAALAQTAQHQDQLLASLEQMLAGLAQWQGYRRFHRDLADLLREQEELNRTTADLGLQTIGRELDDLLPQHVAQLKRLADRQLDLSLRFDPLLDEMRRAAASLASSDPAAAEALANAASESSRLAVGVQMRSVRAAMAANQMGQAAAGQKQIAADLRDVLGILAGTRPQDASRTAEDKLSEEAKQLKARQEALLGQTRLALTPAPPTPVDQLARQQRSLAEETGQWVERLGPQSAFALVMDQTATDMRQAAELLDRRQTADPTQQAQQSALRRLALVLEAIAPEPGTPPEEQGGSQAGQPRQGGPALSLAQLKLLRLLQQDVLARTEELHRAAANDPRRYAELSQEQRRLAELVLQLMRNEK